MIRAQFRYERHLYAIHAALAQEIGAYTAAIDIRRQRRGTPGGTHAAQFTLPESFETKERAIVAGNKAAKKWIDDNPAP